ncbi:MAG TPA: serine/threonine-protein kinase [Labilithrix sp.]|nr:serine/threonine-protein kinase [Labilithrix sp.]
MECPDENTLVALADGTAPSEVRATHARHLDGCPSCRQTVGSLVRLAGASATTPFESGPRSRPLSVEEQRVAFAPTMASDRPPPGSGDAADGGGASVVGDIVAQRYRLDRIVGEGGLGVVWAATHLVTMKPVALKILKFRYPEIDKRFLREARVAGVVNHPNIVDVHDVVQVERDGSLAMVMDLLEGEPLDRHLETHGRLSLGATLRIMHPVLSALAAAHALGIVHRDLKPQNIFLARDQLGGDRPMLLDFGLAKLTATAGVAAQTSVLTKEKQLLGTPQYMAPEQLYGEIDIDARTDVWAVGAVLFECLTGQRPLAGNNVGQVMRSLATREIPKVSSLVPELPPQFAAMIDTMLTRERATRPASVQPVVAAAEWLLANGGR